ncbi:MAG: hypothetical protein ABSH22_12500 [Tepidisphaeraceae bacterium]
MILCALAITLANNVDLYDHIRFAVCVLSLAIASCAAAILLPSLRKLNLSPRRMAAVIGLIIGLLRTALAAPGIAPRGSS